LGASSYIITIAASASEHLQTINPHPQDVNCPHLEFVEYPNIAASIQTLLRSHAFLTVSSRDDGKNWINASKS
jgi:hypothetical protein